MQHESSKNDTKPAQNITKKASCKQISSGALRDVPFYPGEDLKKINSCREILHCATSYVMEQTYSKKCNFLAKKKCRKCQKGDLWKNSFATNKSVPVETEKKMPREKWETQKKELCQN